ncbi:MAG: hypothetical protein BMS9Abin10_1081 [Gammaproteobacteria bacterium]|nr:MAG: hypothetical protein BMS9Abin10_1081 [Gammaproteobacteria bacterium]
MARAFAGTSVHRTLVFIRLTHRSFIYFRFVPVLPLSSVFLWQFENA